MFAAYMSNITHDGEGEQAEALPHSHGLDDPAPK
jgi:hypothetical protein